MAFTSVISGNKIISTHQIKSMFYAHMELHSVLNNVDSPVVT